MSSLKERLDNLKAEIQKDDFLEGKGLSNEVNIRIFCYDPKEEMTVRHFLRQITRDSSLKCHLIPCNLYKIFLEICDEKRITNKAVAMEARKGKDYLVKQIQRIANNKAFVTKMQYEPHESGDVLLITGKDIKAFPIIISNEEEISMLSKENRKIAKNDWDSFEISLDFRKHPLIQENNKLSDSYCIWQKKCNELFNSVVENEKNINKKLSKIYNLEKDVCISFEDRDIPVRKANLEREIKSFISYAIGCMFGRYSLDQEGLIYAGGEWDPEQYKIFQADADNIIPICDDEYFEDDIVGLFIQFVKTVYGEETLEENLKFIADALGGKGSPKEVIRNYFIKDFYKDHCKIYQKRPIYWLFDSGKKNGFKALIYMHRYQPDTIARIRTDYVHQQQSRYRTSLEDLERRLEDADTRERVKLNKKLKTLKSQMDEIHEYEEKIHHLADQMIAIDLDDGVKKNYARFQEVLAKIK